MGREGPAAADDARDTGALRFDLSVQALAALAGTTQLTVAGFKAIDARQPHRAFGVRVAGSPHDARWAVEANVSGEWPAAPTTHRAEGLTALVSGPWLRADAGMRARLRTRLSPTAYAGLGLQWHHRDIKTTLETDPLGRRLPVVGVLALGLGLEYRSGGLLLGLELHVRQDVTAQYHSVSALLSVGFCLDQGE
jgi:hypothetical protein